MSASPDQTYAVEATCPGCFNPRTWDAAATCPICRYNVNSEGRSAALLPVGTQLKDYVIGEKLGQGGFGITYRGFDQTLKMKVAIKEYYPSELVTRATDRKTVVLNSLNNEDIFIYCLKAFLKEAQTLAQIRHPHVVRVLSFFEQNGTAYLVMDYYEGENLKSFLSRRQDSRLPWQQAVAWLLPVLDGLKKLHEINFIHRDIKPSNLYLTEHGLILLDFGSARPVKSDHVKSLLIYTDGYAPYEQMKPEVRNQQGTWTDVYGAAATFYSLLTGQPPLSPLDRKWNSETETLIPARSYTPTLPSEFDDVLRRALAVEPKERTQTIAQFKSELESVLAKDGKPLPEKTPKQQNKLFHWQGVVLVPLMIVLMIGSGWWFGIGSSLEIIGNHRRLPAQASQLETQNKLEQQLLVPVMIKISGGCYQMGSPRMESSRGYDEGQHQVCVRDFEIGQYEVNQQQWQAVMGSNPAHFQSCANCPVENISWNNIQDYLIKLNGLSGKTYRLPTEAEWEYAARAGTKTTHWWGQDIGKNQANCDGCGSQWDNKKTAPVGSFAANPWGLYDTVGNVQEWTCSLYDRNYGGGEKECSSNTERLLAIRGGSWYYGPAWARSAFRYSEAPTYRSSDLGFRLARSL